MTFQLNRFFNKVYYWNMKLAIAIFFVSLQLYTVNLYADKYDNIIQNDSNNVKSEKYKNSIFIELLGVGYELWSINYEGTFLNTENYTMNFRFGTNFTYTLSKPMFYLTFPVLINFNIKLNKRIYYEIEGGYLLHTRYLIGSTGFRYQSKDGFLIKIDFILQYNTSNKFYNIEFNSGHNTYFNAWFGLSFGKRFGKGKKSLFHNIVEFQENYYKN